ncbi:PIN domain-containing protein [Candidatus Bathyarchaeota archaeon]|nr:PIN domain-containing protein [Candidatus Bathyarchaeota archaeon]
MKLLLDESSAIDAQRILESIEADSVLGFLTPLVLEEVVFKLIYATASSKLNTSNVWKIRGALKSDKALRKECTRVVEKFNEYVEYLASKGLRIESVHYSDWLNSLEYIGKYGLLPADAIHVAVARRLKVDIIASFDEDFKAIEELKVIP